MGSSTSAGGRRTTKPRRKNPCVSVAAEIAAEATDAKATDAKDVMTEKVETKKTNFGLIPG